MCGICGIFSPEGHGLDVAAVERMSAALHKRGPDDAGLSRSSVAVLGHRRLAIIDLSAAGHQPMRLADGSLEVVYNGEIYNYRELRDELESRGRRFRSDTDTEIILHGAAVWGIDALLDRVRGMYAFALVDHPRRRLVLARDPVGKKPLYYAVEPGESGRVSFASSALALARGMAAPPTVSPRAVDAYLMHFYVQPPATIFEVIAQVAPGTMLTFGDGAVRERNFWSLRFSGDDDSRTVEEWDEAIEPMLQRAIRRRLVADVPVGVLLSGGIDSGLVAALAARERPILTFSVATQDPALDESPLAEQVARRHGTQHLTLPVDADLLPRFDALVAGLCAPLGDPSAANVFAIAEAAKERVGVVLTGDGGDEAFGGYSSFWAYYHATRLQRLLPQSARPLADEIATRVRKLPPPWRRAGTLLHYAAAPIERSIEGTGWVAHDLRSSLFTTEAAAALDDPFAHHRQSLRAIPGGDVLVDRAMTNHFRTILPGDYLAKVDGATMAVSLEARCPFLDVDLLELAARMPASVRFSEGKPKAMLRRMARRVLPRDILKGRKRGFVAPVGSWLRGSWRELVHDVVLGDLPKRGWFQKPALERIVKRHREGHDHGYLIWTLLVLERWLQLAQRTSDSPPVK